MTDTQTPSDPFELLRRLWGTAGIPVPGMAMPTLDPQEVEKRVAELRALEGWLAANLNMVKLAIQGLEMQKAALLAMRGAGEAKQPGSATDASRAGEAQADNPLLWPWSLMQQAMAGTAPEPAGTTPPATPKSDKTDKTDKTDKHSR